MGPYNQEPSASRDNLKIANKATNEILCLPFYGEMKISQVAMICKKIQSSKLKSGF
jgi:dTDP-4-amino-4,6-dideoxygalactose transaminase